MKNLKSYIFQIDFQTVLDGQDYNLSSLTIQREVKLIGSKEDRTRTIPSLASSTIGSTNHFENAFPLATNPVVAEYNWIEFRHFWMFNTQNHYDFVQTMIADMKLEYPAAVEVNQVRSPIQSSGGSGSLGSKFEHSDVDDDR